MKKASYQGLDITIEIPAGTTRKGVNSKTGEKWSQELDDNYGYILKTNSPDGEHLDCYLAANPVDGDIVVIHQLTPDGTTYDEDKVMLGFGTKAQAIKAFKKYSYKPEMLGGVSCFNIEHFKAIAYSASNSKAILATEEQLEKLKDKIPRGVRSPTEVALRVSESYQIVLEYFDMNDNFKNKKQILSTHSSYEMALKEQTQLLDSNSLVEKHQLIRSLYIEKPNDTY